MVITSSPRQTMLCLGEPPRLGEGLPTPSRTQKVLLHILPSYSSSPFQSLSSSFACFFLHVLQNIAEWGISVILMNKV